MRATPLFVIMLFICSCDKEHPFREKIDTLSFEVFGRTLFKTPDSLTTKELLFDTGRLIGRDVVVEAEVLSWGEHDTHIVVKDKFGRLLVVTTQLKSLDKYRKQAVPKSLKIMGTVEREKKGLPFILAKAIKPEGVGI